jgi:hypothetical protein
MQFACRAPCAAADAGADTSYVDDAGYNLLQHTCLTGAWDWVTWALQNGCVLPEDGVKGLVRALRQGKLAGITVRAAENAGCCLA